MSSRKSSAASRGKDWSTETTSSDDMIVFPGIQNKPYARGSNMIQMPLRNPVIPPPIEKQKDEGFTRFLKKHSSPTHQRVTAGGRIVPIEPRPSPPVFTPTDKSIAAADTSETKHPDNTIIRDKDHGSTPLNVKQNQLVFPENQQINNANLSLVQADPLPTPGFVASRPAMHGPVTPFVGTPFGPTGSMGFIPTEQSVYIANTSMCYQPEGVPYDFGPQHGIHEDANIFTAQLSAPWAFGEQHVYNNSCGGNPFWAHEILSQQCVSAQQSLVYWQQRYNELEQQLRNLDRHRAMTNLDRSLAEQRRVLVQQRSDVKDMIHKIKTMLDFSHQAESSGDSFSGGFNVNAAPYVPSNIQTNEPPMTNVKKVPTDNGIQTISGEKPHLTGIRRPIPIVPPSSVVTETASPTAMNNSSHVARVHSYGDDWGVQVRQAPPSIKREHSTISESLSKNSSQSPNSNERSSASESDKCPRLVPENHDSNFNNQEIQNHDSDHNELGNGSSSNSTHVKDAYSKLLDAMRQPKGKITKVQLEGQWIDIEGQGLQLRASKLMEFWEQDYWADQSKDRTQPLHSHAIGNGSINKENDVAHARGHQKAATDAFVAQLNAIEENELAASRRETRSLRMNSDMGLLHSTNVLREVYGINSNDQLSSLPSSNQRVVYTPTSSTNTIKVSRKVAGDDELANHATIDNALTASEYIGAKGPSSVSIQNVHAVGRLPHNLDGSIESSRDAKGALSTVNGAYSPRLVYRTTANGVAWYGPYCREAIEKALGQDKVPTTHKRSFM